MARKIAELDRAVALDAGDRRLAGQIALGETVDHRFPEAVLVIEDVVRDAERLGDPARIVNVLARAAGTLAMDRRPMVVELQRDPDDIVALLAEQACHHGGIYAAGHGDDDTWSRAGPWGGRGSSSRHGFAGRPQRPHMRSL